MSEPKSSEPKPPDAKPAKPMPRFLNLFISYAREDAKIAIAVSTALRAALGEIADVFFDKDSITSGFEFKTQIEDALAKADVLVVVYTGTEKPSHSYTGWEIGFFRGLQRLQPADADVRKRIVALYLLTPPATVAEIQGISLGITTETLSLTKEAFGAQLTTAVTADHPMVVFLNEMVKIVEDLKDKQGFPKVHSAVDTVGIVTVMLTEIFVYLKSTIDKVLKPQKQIVIRTSVAALEAAEGNLPDDALLAAVGTGGPMALFGLPDAPVRWGDFVKQVSAHKFGSAWREAINGVVASSLPNQIDVDNSQVILSSDELRIYRVILTTSTTYFNGDKDVSIYFVEALRRKDYGDKDTSLILRALDLVCRFRFMFLESHSEFYAPNVQATAIDRVPALARDVVRELNLMGKDARETGLDQPHIWARFIAPETIVEMSKVWAPREARLRELAGILTRHRGDAKELEPTRAELVTAISEIERAMAAHNQRVISEMTRKLSEIVGGAP